MTTQTQIKDLEEQLSIVDEDLLVFERVLDELETTTYSIPFMGFSDPLLPKDFSGIPTGTLKIHDQSLIIRNAEWRRTYSEQLAFYVMNIEPLSVKDNINDDDFLYVFSNFVTSKVHYRHIRQRSLSERTDSFLGIALEGGVSGSTGSPIILTDQTALVISTFVDGTKHNHDAYYSLKEHTHSFKDIIGLNPTEVIAGKGCIVDVLDEKIEISLKETVNSIVIIPDPSVYRPYINVQKAGLSWTIINTYFNDAFRLVSGTGIKVETVSGTTKINNADPASKINIKGIKGAYAVKKDTNTWEISISALPTPSPTGTGTATPTGTRTPTPSTTKTLSATPTPSLSNTPIPSSTPSISHTPSASFSQTPAPSPAPGVTPTKTPVWPPAPSNTPRPSNTPQPSRQPGASATPSSTKTHTAAAQPSPTPSKSKVPPSPTPSKSQVSQYPMIFNIKGNLTATKEGGWTIPTQVVDDNAQKKGNSTSGTYKIALQNHGVQFWMSPSHDVAEDIINDNSPEYGNWSVSGGTLTWSNPSGPEAKVTKTGSTCTVTFTLAVTNHFDKEQNKPTKQRFVQSWTVSC